VLRANRESESVAANDVAITNDDRVSDGILRYHDVMARLAGRNDIRDAVTKYEAIAICLVEAHGKETGTFAAGFPPAGSDLSFATFFEKLYSQYDTRFVYSAPGLKGITRRLEWAPDSPAIVDARIAEYQPRLS
jgi:hypothetical protein